MKILIVNDDGMGAAQLVPLIKWCRKLGDVTVAVPKFEQSGKSHSIELLKPFEAQQVELEPGVTIWAVDSTPADCVRFAVLALKQKFDLVISGVNRGWNIGPDTMYSGTVGAASEAVNLGMKAIALSTSYRDYPRATEQLDQVFDFIQKNKLLELHNIYNINIPADAKGIKITRIGDGYNFGPIEQVEEGRYYLNKLSVWEDRNDDTQDTDASRHGYISITPLYINKTCQSTYEKLAQMNLSE